MLRLRDIMTTDVMTITPETTVREAMETLARHHVSGAPVVSGGTIIGVVTATDLMAVAADAEPGDTFFSEPWDDTDAAMTGRMGASIDAQSNALEEHDVGEAMTRSLTWLPPDADVVSAAELMRRLAIHRVLVIDEGCLVGIVTALDIAKAVADRKLESRRYVFGHGAADPHRRWP